ncbi:MAG: 16S rRNA (cytidine(1402)-2'-O)-methyltransferase [Alphaproteobacteria bacterium]|nr:16S rRNA (cytidine(1402)-2'-O)-methyltransferase [Alphaproteobacteria bacterium]
MHQSLDAGLYFVSTPIGAARDITLRGLDILKTADVLAAEDTRNTRHLMDIHGVKLEGRSLIPYHDHNGSHIRPKLIALIKGGKSVAYVSDAGTPLIADPGYALARDVITADLKVIAAPGASAVLAALAVAGLPTDRFFFAGFLPQKKVARRKSLASLANIPGTLVIYESPKRVGKSLSDMVLELGGDRSAAVCRELTKKFEEVRRGSLAELQKAYQQETPKGEIVVVIGPAPDREISNEMLEDALKVALRQHNSLRDAVDQVTKDTDLARKKVYQMALAMEQKR